MAARPDGRGEPLTTRGRLRPFATLRLLESAALVAEAERVHALIAPSATRVAELAA